MLVVLAFRRLLRFDSTVTEAEISGETSKLAGS